MTGWDKDQFVHHWKYYPVPARPSPSEIDFIRKRIIEKGKDSTVLILGSTPEYRNMCGEIGVKVTCFDFLKYNYEYLSDDVKHKPEEKFVEGNWTDKAIKEKFDFILGDHVIDVIKKQDAEKLLVNCSKMLKKDGMLILRTYVREKGEKITPEQALEIYRKKQRKNKSINFLSYTLRNFHLSAYDFEKDYLVTRDVWKAVKDLHDKGLVSDEELELYRKIDVSNRDFQFFIPLKEWLEDIFSGIFSIAEVYNGTEEYINNQIPMHVLTLK